MSLQQYRDPEIDKLTLRESHRIEETLNLIAAENHAPPAIMEALGSVFNTKTIEGYPGKRFHAGCVHADGVERLAISRAKEVFKAEHANVQPHSGTSANLGVYFSILEIGDKILSMTLSHGGHLSHGHPASIAGKCFKIKHYGVDGDTGLIDYEKMSRLAESFQPKLIVAGASSYPRLIDYQYIANVAAAVGAYFMVDMAHIGGLVAAGVIPSPVSVADFVTLTCYKTMMGGRGGIILCKDKFAKQVDKSIFPGCQGTSAVNSIAAKAIILGLAHTDPFVTIQNQTLDIARVLAERFIQKGYNVIANGTDTHQVILDVTSMSVDGGTAENALEAANIIVNKNIIPGDETRPGMVSGVRLGSSAMAARGMGRKQANVVVDLIDQIIRHVSDQDIGQKVKEKVVSLCHEYPVYTHDCKICMP